MRLVPRRLAVVAALLLSCGRHASHGEAGAGAGAAGATAAATPANAVAPRPGHRLHVQRLFTLALPDDFERVRSDDAGRPELRPGENLARFEDGRGRFLAIAFDAAGAGYSADATWTLVPAPSGDALTIIAEEPPCRAPRYASSEEAVWAEDSDCPAGDGRLTIAATAELRGHRYVFFFGDDRRERGVELDAFREALATFRAR